MSWSAWRTSRFQSRGLLIGQEGPGHALEEVVDEERLRPVQQEERRDAPGRGVAEEGGDLQAQNPSKAKLTIARATSTAARWTASSSRARVCVTCPATRKSARSSIRSCFQMTRSA